MIRSLSRDLSPCVQVGVHPTGPWWGSVTGSPSERLVHGLEAFALQYGANAKPDIVVFASNLWDLQRIGSRTPEKFVGQSIEDNELHGFRSDLTAVLKQIEVRAHLHPALEISQANMDVNIDVNMFRDSLAIS